MPSYTRAQLATRVLKDLGLVASEESPSAIDQSWAEETCQSELGLLAAKGIPLWNGGDNEIPHEYLTLLSRRICLAQAPSFGLSDVATATLAMQSAEADLRRLGSVATTGAVVKADYY